MYVIYTAYLLPVQLIKSNCIKFFGCFYFFHRVFSFFFGLAICITPVSLLPMGLKVHTASGGGGCTLIFSHIRRLGLFLGFKILNFNILGGFQKHEYFWGV